MAANVQLAWCVYAGAAVLGLALAWLGLRRFMGVDAQRVILLCLAALLAVPANIEADSGSWAPAFMAALMEGIDNGGDAALERLWPSFVVMLVLVLLSLAWRLYHMGRRKAAAD